MDLLKQLENKVNLISKSNEDLGRYGDGFEDAIKLVKEAINELKQ